MIVNKVIQRKRTNFGLLMVSEALDWYLERKDGLNDRERIQRPPLGFALFYGVLSAIEP